MAAPVVYLRNVLQKTNQLYIFAICFHVGSCAPNHKFDKPFELARNIKGRLAFLFTEIRKWMISWIVKDGIKFNAEMWQCCFSLLSLLAITYVLFVKEDYSLFLFFSLFGW